MRVFIITFMLIFFPVIQVEANLNFNADYESVFKHYKRVSDEKRSFVEKTESKRKSITEDEKPGRVIGKKTKEIQEAIDSNWEYRAKTYELYFESQTVLAESVYSLAKFTKDISSDVPLSKVKKGVSAFHYSAEQICDYIAAVERNELTISAEERKLVSYLIKDGVVVLVNGKCEAPYIQDVVGVSSSKKRSLKSNLTHERLHIYWDKDQSLRSDYTERWESLNKAQQDDIKKKLKQYDVSNTDQIIEEWAIYDKEKQYSL